MVFGDSESGWGVAALESGRGHLSPKELASALNAHALRLCRHASDQSAASRLRNELASTQSLPAPDPTSRERPALGAERALTAQLPHAAHLPRAAQPLVRAAAGRLTPPDATAPQRSQSRIGITTYRVCSVPGA
jgi:hypothetical protein